MLSLLLALTSTSDSATVGMAGVIGCRPITSSVASSATSPLTWEGLDCVKPKKPEVQLENAANPCNNFGNSSCENNYSIPLNVGVPVTAPGTFTIDNVYPKDVRTFVYDEEGICNSVALAGAILKITHPYTANRSYTKDAVHVLGMTLYCPLNGDKPYWEPDSNKNH